MPSCVVSWVCGVLEFRESCQKIFLSIASSLTGWAKFSCVSVIFLLCGFCLYGFPFLLKFLVDGFN